MTLSACPHCAEGAVDNLVGSVCNKCGKDPLSVYITMAPIIAPPAVYYKQCPTCGSFVPENEDKSPKKF